MFERENHFINKRLQKSRRLNLKCMPAVNKTNGNRYSHGHGISSVVVIQLTLAVKQVLYISNSTLKFLTWMSKMLMVAF
jgi:hypothetical protein